MALAYRQMALPYHQQHQKAVGWQQLLYWLCTVKQQG